MVVTDPVWFSVSAKKVAPNTTLSFQCSTFLYSAELGTQALYMPGTCCITELYSQP